MATGSYDHPSFLARQQLFVGRTTAGANGTNCQTGWASAMRVRTVTATVITAGTATDTVVFLNGTTSVGQIVFGTQAALTVVTSSDVNSTVAVGTTFSYKNGADATRVVAVVYEATLDPAATWV